MRADENRYKDILDNLYDGVYFVDRQRRITYWNRGAERISGYKASQVLGKRCLDNILNHVSEYGIQLCLNGCPLHATMDDGKPREAEVYLHHSDGHRIPVLVRTSPIRDADGEIIGAVESFSDNSSLLTTRRRVNRLEQTVLLDPLTGIGNRRFIDIRIQSAFFEYQQHRIPFGVLFMDIDDFKIVNDRFGHEIGDRALQLVASTLNHNLRGDDAVARWGGEEFIALLAGVDRDGLLNAAEKLRTLVESSPVLVGKKAIPLTISVGATMLRLEDDPASLLRRADQYMYASKNGGRNRVTIDPQTPDGMEKQP
jgi:diguanylate cyclase (GGDEF)-like protein/PAS domain S-box-containing protein